MQDKGAGTWAAGPDSPLSPMGRAGMEPWWARGRGAEAGRQAFAAAGGCWSGKIIPIGSRFSAWNVSSARP